MKESIFTMLFVIGCGALPCLVSGYLIVFKQKRRLISGWHDAKYSNPQRAANVIGYSLIILSMFLTALAILVGYDLVSKSLINFSLVILLIPIVAAIYANKKYGVK